MKNKQLFNAKFIDGRTIQLFESYPFIEKEVYIFIIPKNETMSSDYSETSAKQDIITLKRLSSEGKGRSKGWSFNREEIYDRNELS